MHAGYLRRCLAVSADEARVTLHHPFWSLDLPRDWVDAVPGLWAVFSREAPVGTLDRARKGVAGLVTLLSLQGCLSYADDRPAYTLREVRDLFRPVATSWYGRYYRHPLWTRLREGTLSRRGLVAWLLHNYHVSRSAGMSDARCAVRLPRAELRRVFARNAIDEYSHCDDYFFVRHERLRLADEDVKRYVHLAPSLAFDQQMLRMAEEDWLGHLLVSLFQESSARFADQTRAFYRQVEARYGLDGLFSPWEKHLELDLRCGHAGRLDELLDSDATYAREEVVRSLRNAWFTFQHLYDSLSAIVRAGDSGEDPALRLPVREGRLDPKDPFVARAAPGVHSPVDLPASDGEALCQALVQGGAGEMGASAPPLADDVTFLLRDLTSSIFGALSHSREHDEVILFGRLAQSAVSRHEPCLAGEAAPASAAAMAVAGYFREAAVMPAEAAFLLRWALIDRGAGWIPVDDDGLRRLSRFLAQRRVSPETRDHWATRALQLNEMTARWREQGARAETVDFFRD